MLWVVLANVSGGDWSQQTQEWQEAAARWRDNYFAALTASKNPEPPDRWRVQFIARAALLDKVLDAIGTKDPTEALERIAAFRALPEPPAAPQEPLREPVLRDLIDIVKSMQWECGCGQINFVGSHTCLVCGRHYREDQR